MKICRTCAKSLHSSAYYRCEKAADGLHGSCKECVKARVRAYREDNLARVQQYDHTRGMLPHRKEAVRRRYREMVADPVQRANAWSRVRANALRHPERRKARVIVGNAIRDGRLKPQPCERCRYGIGIHAHHEDYSKPLDVTWLCRPCHGERHREINAERRKAAA